MKHFVVLLLAGGAALGLSATASRADIDVPAAPVSATPSQPATPAPAAPAPTTAPATAATSSDGKPVVVIPATQGNPAPVQIMPYRRDAITGEYIQNGPAAAEEPKKESLRDQVRSRLKKP